MDNVRDGTVEEAFAKEGELISIEFGVNGERGVGAGLLWGEVGEDEGECI